MRNDNSVQTYLPRIIDKEIDRYLNTFGAVCIEGPKWCGKTRTCQEHCRSSVMLGDPHNNFQNRKLAEMSADLVLDGESPRLIDEWQEVPPIWDAVRYRVDSLHRPGCFLLTGSATPNQKGILHSGAGRIARLRMRPMSLWESGDSKGTVSLEMLCLGEMGAAMTGEVKLTDLIHLIIRGGWPASLNMTTEEASLTATQYLQAVLSDDTSRIDGVRRERRKLELVLRSLARHESTTAKEATLLRDIEQEQDKVSRLTLTDYLDVFQRLFLLDNQRPFSPSVRSKIRIKQSEKRHFSDPSLPAAILGLDTNGLLNDLETLGFLFEALCERDLRIYAESFGGQLFHYQDYRDREIDAVVALPDGSWTAFEIKLGTNQIDAAAENLLRLSESLAADNPKAAPTALCVISGLTNAAYRRDDGVFVVPITSLKP